MCGLIIEHLGWEAVFYITAGITLVWVVIWQVGSLWRRIVIDWLQMRGQVLRVGVAGRHAEDGEDGAQDPGGQDQDLPHCAGELWLADWWSQDL